MATTYAPLPRQKFTVMRLLQEAGADTSDWKNYKGRSPAANPKYCYNWAFEEPGKTVVVCIWHPSLTVEHGKSVYRRDREPPYRRGTGETVWKTREADFSRALQQAYQLGLPVRVILLDGERRSEQASEVHYRILDTEPWAVVEYNAKTGGCLLVRGEKPVGTPALPLDPELEWFEGWKRWAFVQHRSREGEARHQKIAEALKLNDGRLRCEVPGCGFDFLEVYGELGRGYAHVHHLLPLSRSPEEGRILKLGGLAIVCPNCHAMIHLGGECRPLEDLILARSRVKEA